MHVRSLLILKSTLDIICFDLQVPSCPLKILAGSPELICLILNVLVLTLKCTILISDALLCLFKLSPQVLQLMHVRSLLFFKLLCLLFLRLQMMLKLFLSLLCSILKLLDGLFQIFNIALLCGHCHHLS